MDETFRGPRMIRMSVAADSSVLSELQYRLAKLGQGSMPSTAGAMGAGAKMIRDTWKGFALGGTLPGIAEPLKRPNGGYARSIRVEKLGPFEYEIMSEAEIADWIENGTREHDMKTTHPFGPRSRMSAEGFPYLIIPIRWGTPKTIGFKNVMPESVYKIVKNKKEFRQTKTLMTKHNEPNYKGEDVARSEYSGADGKKEWGDRLSADMGEGVTGDMEGMSSMLGQDGKASGYLTFRVISAKQLLTSPYKWIKPAMPARKVTKAVADNTGDAIDGMVESAIMEDLGL
jgi:hypothetical protein